jgi:hypothetical protein
MDCEAIEDNDEKASACFQKRRPSDEFFAAM